MLELENSITIDKDTIESPNLCDKFTEDDLRRVGIWVSDNYKRDKASRMDWERRSEAGMNLAMQVQETKTFPWPNCSNIAFPLVTIAALQFHARAYPAIVNGRKVVSCTAIGEDKTGMAKRRADLISSHMNYQLLEQDEAWEEGEDRALLNVAIVGCGWKKTYYDASNGHSTSEFVQAKDLIVDYWAKSITSAAVKTHYIPMYKNDVRERMVRGTYRDCRRQQWYEVAPMPQQTNAQDQSDNRAGIIRPESADGDTPFIILEQHCWLDLDKDGYKEPYIVTIEESSCDVLRIVARFDRIEDVERTEGGEIIKITANEYFSKIPFIPSPDGSIMDVGFGVLLGPLNESVNSAINQLFDSGTLANTAGGFLGRGAKIRGGVYQFQPFSWNRVDSTGDDLRKSIYPLPVREPSNVMFNLLTLLIEYVNRVSGSTDMMVGENPGQNTPAETSRAMLEQGQKIYSAIFKRIWRGLKQEFKKVFNLNAVYLPDRVPFGEAAEIRREDYVAGAMTVVPVADPTITSDVARFSQAQMLREAAMSAPGYNMDEVEKRYLKAMGFDDIDTLYPGSEAMGPPAPDVKVQIQQMKNDLAMAQLEQSKNEFIITMQLNSRLNSAKIAELEAKANLLSQQADSLPAKQSVEAFRAGIEALREQNKNIDAQIERLMEERKNGRATAGQVVSGGIPELEGTSNNQEILPISEATA